MADIQTTENYFFHLCDAAGLATGLGGDDTVMQDMERGKSHGPKAMMGEGKQLSIGAKAAVGLGVGVGVLGGVGAVWWVLRRRRRRRMVGMGGAGWGAEKGWRGGPWKRRQGVRFGDGRAVISAPIQPPSQYLQEPSCPSRVCFGDAGPRCRPPRLISEAEGSLLGGGDWSNRGELTGGKKIRPSLCLQPVELRAERSPTWDGRAKEMSGVGVGIGSGEDKEKIIDGRQNMLVEDLR